jgi:hypothetical protein
MPAAIGYYVFMLVLGVVLGGAVGYIRGTHVGVSEGYHNLSAHFRIRGR